MPKKFLVTGGAGFIGSNIVSTLLSKGHLVRVLDNFSTGKRENLNEFKNDIDLVEGDIRSYHIVRQAVKGIEVILHQAALPSVPRSINDPITSNEVNVMGTLNLLDAAKDEDVRRIVYASSSSVYGDNPELPKHEKMVANPMSPYAVSKLAGEKYCNVFSKLYNIETVALRYFNVFGPRQDPNSQYSAVIPKFINLFKAGKSPVIFGDGEQSRDFTFVENVVKANLLAAERSDGKGVVVNCACGERITLNSVVANLQKSIDSNIEPIYESTRSGDVKHSHASIDKIKNELGFKPSVLFNEGLKRTIEYYV
jgi:nucleoside-diphosphate-sugar epimerase